MSLTAYAWIAILVGFFLLAYAAGVDEGRRDREDDRDLPE